MSALKGNRELSQLFWANQGFREWQSFPTPLESPLKTYPKHTYLVRAFPEREEECCVPTSGKIVSTMMNFPQFKFIGAVLTVLRSGKKNINKNIDNNNICLFLTYNYTKFSFEYNGKIAHFFPSF